MENLYDPKYLKRYKQGYCFGLNPVFSDFEDISRLSTRFNTQGFRDGFACGRMEYEALNGSLENGIPAKILSQTVLDDFLLLGMTGMAPEMSGYTQTQKRHILKSYERGLRQHNPDHDIILFSLLDESGVAL